VRLGRLQESLSVLETGLALYPHSADLWRYRAWALAELGRFEEAFECMESARQNGATDKDYYHVHGDLLLLSGQYLDALQELDVALSNEPDNWDIQADRQIALGCVGQQGPLMEALPAGLAQVKIPPQSESSVCDFAYEVALGSLRRGEDQIGLGLFAATVGMQSWHSSEWFRHQAGSFLRRTLDVSPGMYQSFVSLVAERVKDENTVKLLDPFLQAGEFLRTGNLVLLERLSPEVRELVLDIVRRVEPVRYEELRRLV
jgi:tetratricopeptide (TPR) repeat protein